MSQYVLLVSFVDYPEAFVSEMSEASIALIKEKCVDHEEPLKGFDDTIYTLDCEEYVVISDSVQRACYIALCKRINDYLKYLKPEDVALTKDYMTIAYQQGVSSLLNVETMPESRIINYIAKSF